jgi:Transposase DDE domain
MYKPNKKHLQPPLISNVQALPEKHRQRLEQSWAGEFYRQFFCRLTENAFTCLYADFPSRPNIPVNVLVGLDTLKAGFGWSDEELYDHFTFDVQVRYALGYHNLAEGDFDIRSLYNFRRRLSQYNLEHGVNLLEACFEDITDQQVIAFKVKTNQQRMDSTMIASNILDSSRLPLAAELLQRIDRLLSEADQVRYAELLRPYLKDTLNQFVYRIKGKEQVQEQLIHIGKILYQLLNELRAGYAQHPFFPVAERFFTENFLVETENVQPKDGKELSSGCLQSLDDLEASYRQKGQKFYKGYVANVTETCYPKNDMQLITKVQAAANNVEDADLLMEALPNLAERTNLEQLFTDGGFGSPEVDQALRQEQVEQIQSAIRGTHLNPDKLHLSAYDLRQDAQGEPTQITCPYGQTVVVQPTPSHRSFLARFDPAVCDPCPFHTQDRCRILWRKRCAKFQMDFTQQEVDAAVRRRRCLENKQASKNLRAAVEATVRSVKHPFPAGKLPVRGLFRLSCLLIGSAAMVNIRRITLIRRLKTTRRQTKTCPKLLSSVSGNVSKTI